MPLLPDQVSGLAHWWRADDIGLTNGAAVSSWSARTGGVTMSQATGANQPAYQTAGLSGQPSVRFTGSPQLLTGSIAAAINQPFTWVAVCFTTTTATSQTLMADTGGSVTAIELITPNWTGWGGAANLSGGAATTSPTVIIFSGNGASSQVFLNGVGGTVATSGTSPMAIGTMQFGKHPSLSRFFTGDLAEACIYNKTLSADERSLFDSYVTDRYGFSTADALVSEPLHHSRARFRASLW